MTELQLFSFIMQPPSLALSLSNASKAKGQYPKCRARQLCLISRRKSRPEDVWVGFNITFGVAVSKCCCGQYGDEERR